MSDTVLIRETDQGCVSIEKPLLSFIGQEPASIVAQAAGAATVVSLQAATNAFLGVPHPLVVDTGNPCGAAALIVAGTSGAPGPPGPTGPSGGTADIVAVADGAISALRVVKVVNGSVLYASSNIESDADLVTGISLTAALDGDSVTVRTDGEMSDAGWNWLPGAIYCGVNGFLTQIVPAIGFIGEVARAITATRIVVDVQLPIVRA